MWFQVEWLVSKVKNLKYETKKSFSMKHHFRLLDIEPLPQPVTCILHKVTISDLEMRAHPVPIVFESKKRTRKNQEDKQLTKESSNPGLSTPAASGHDHMSSSPGADDDATATRRTTRSGDAVRGKPAERADSPPLGGSAEKRRRATAGLPQGSLSMVFEEGQDNSSSTDSIGPPKTRSAKAGETAEGYFHPQSPPTGGHQHHHNVRVIPHVIDGFLIEEIVSF
eukprot:comp18384_c0_seq1/m.32758 comp18384_c0_seq1/g.32758  ORF comp18384_c0_seq1/g.32758 comp18384_c0_seq1/m.32758 type:complete len:224 (-) comp18384_c0_seq1:150-821(-)